MVAPRGYALIETLLASMILVSGLVGIASIFSFTAQINSRNQQRTVATLLLYDKMEQLRSSDLTAGGGLDPSLPVAGFMEYVHVAGDGTTVADGTNSPAAYLRLWQVRESEINAITIVVFGRTGAMVRPELARATASW